MSSSLSRHDGEAHARSISQSSRRYARLSRTESIYHSSFTSGASDLRRRYYVTPSQDKRSRFPVNRNSHGKRQSRGIFVNDDLVFTNANEFISLSLFLSLTLGFIPPSTSFTGIKQRRGEISQRASPERDRSRSPFSRNPRSTSVRFLSKSLESAPPARSSLIQKLRKEIAFILLAGDLSAFTCELFPGASEKKCRSSSERKLRPKHRYHRSRFAESYPRVSLPLLLISVDTKYLILMLILTVKCTVVR